MTRESSIGGWCDDDATTVHALAHVVVRFAFKRKRDTGREECAEGLSGATRGSDGEHPVRQSGVTMAPGNLA